MPGSKKAKARQCKQNRQINEKMLCFRQVRFEGIVGGITRTIVARQTEDPFLNSHGRTTTLPTGVVGFNDPTPLILGNDLLHDFQKFPPHLVFFLRQLYLMSVNVSCFFALHHSCFDAVIIPFLEPLW